MKGVIKTSGFNLIYFSWLHPYIDAASTRQIPWRPHTKPEVKKGHLLMLVQL